jgi:diguanylate cyclase
MTTVRYSEPKDKSAELLRLTLAHMGKHTAAFNPLTFTLWYEYALGGNARLNAAIDAVVAQGNKVDDASVVDLCQKYVYPPDASTVDQVRTQMAHLMKGVAQTASMTSNRAGRFGEQLTGLSAALASQDLGHLQPQLSEMLAGTAEMKQSIDALQSKVQSSQAEIERLRNDLERARGEALTDPLTGILNRKGFDKVLQAMLAKPAAEGRSHCLVMLDIDHFKQVNDTHGHLMGDRVIQAMGEILRSTVTMPSATTARYGGEEFAILLPGGTRELSRQVAEAVRTRAKALKIRNRTTQEVLVTVTVSGGVAGMQPGDDAHSLVQRADDALYASKQAGRDRVTVV